MTTIYNCNNLHQQVQELSMNLYEVKSHIWDLGAIVPNSSPLFGQSVKHFFLG